MVEKRGTLRGRTRQIETLAQFKEIAASIDGYEQKLQELIPPETKLLDFQSWISRLGSDYGVSVRSAFHGTGKTVAGNVSTNGFSLEVNGAPTNIRAFLNDLERTSDRYIVRLSGLEVSESRGLYSIRTSGEVLYRTPS